MSATQDLLFNYQHIIEDFRLVMGTKGVFDVVVDGEVLFSKHAEDRYAEPGEILDRFEKLVGADVPRFGQ